MGSYNIGTIQAGQYFDSLKGTSGYTSPPAGSYFVTMPLTEWNGSNDVIIDYKSFSTGLNVEGNDTNDDGGGGGGGCFITTSVF